MQGKLNHYGFVSPLAKSERERLVFSDKPSAIIISSANARAGVCRQVGD